VVEGGLSARGDGELVRDLVARVAPPGAPRYLNRELSWLDFNERVLAMAERDELPLLERVKFLAIFSQNLDEFFQVRIGTLLVEALAGLDSGEKERIDERLHVIADRVGVLVNRQSALFAGEVAPALGRAGIRLVHPDHVDAEDSIYLDGVFFEQVFPVLTPLAVDPAHPFPFISNLSLNLAVVVRAPGELTRRIARVKVPPNLPRFLPLPAGGRFVLLEQLIASRLAALFPGMEILECAAFRVTRNTDYEIELDGSDSMVEAVESVLSRRRRSALVTRLEVESQLGVEASDLLARELRIEPRDIVAVDGLLDLADLWSLLRLDRPDLKEPPWTGVTDHRLRAAAESTPDLFSVVRAGDVLVQHPYDAFETSVEEFIEQAAADPAVLAIKQTLYRTSAAETEIMKALIRAAADGKQVVCVVELKARFDEEANIGWAQRLEDAGVHVTYGVVGLKTHAKLCLVVREEEGRLHRYAHVGTGNYNPDTARSYEDIGLLTAEPAITAEVSDVFNLLTGYSRGVGFRNLVVAPVAMRDRLLELIRGQAHEGGRITFKMNSLVDHTLIDALYEASEAGARIDLVVRGICCLRPGVPGLSERIAVRSIVGRYLEHSRIYRFGEGEDATFLVGSADLMPRNLDRRVEVLVPVRDPVARRRLDEVLDLVLADDELAWTLDGEGDWSRGESGETNVQHRLEELALARTRRISAVPVEPQ
jgi:polyphosphate kinase